MCSIIMSTFESLIYISFVYIHRAVLQLKTFGWLLMVGYVLAEICAKEKGFLFSTVLLFYT